jgi:hypothetical protein
MPIQSANLVKKIAFALCVRGGNTKKRPSTTLSRIPFRHPTQFQLNNLPRRPRTTTENVRSSTEHRSTRYVGSSFPRFAKPPRPRSQLDAIVELIVFAVHDLRRLLASIEMPSNGV